VRAALLLVQRGEVDLGIVYATDAVAGEGVVIKATFPESSHAPIRYPVALTVTASPAARAFLAYLRGELGRRAFELAGFTFLEGAGDAH
jgi:molybdate transport system substrate-binding protein